MAHRPPTEQRLEPLLAETEALLYEVKTEYELYFMGKALRAPMRKAQQLHRKIMDLSRHFTSNTQTKFRRQSLRSRYGSLSAYWRRTMAQMESGTYRRHQVMADKRDSERRMEELRAERAATRTSAESQEGSRSYQGESTDLARDYIQIRERLGESVKGLDEKKVLRTLKQHAAALRKKTGCREVAFRVDVKDGKSKLLAIPVKD